MEWSNDRVLSLLEMYRARPVLWDCRLSEYRDRNRRHQAIVEMAEIIGVTKEVVERKLKNLICHFSREVKKERDSVKSAAGVEDVYKSKWFAYQSMEFLKGRKRTKGMNEAQDHLDPESSEPDDVFPNIDAKDEVRSEVLDTSTSSSRKRRRPSPSTLRNNADVKPRANAERRWEGGRDQYSVFGEQVAMQIRDLPSDYARKVVKLVISNVLFEAEMGRYDQPPAAQSALVAHLYHQPFGLPLYLPPRAFQGPATSDRLQRPPTSPASRPVSCDPDISDNDSVDDNGLLL